MGQKMYQLLDIAPAWEMLLLHLQFVPVICTACDCVSHNRVGIKLSVPHISSCSLQSLCVALLSGILQRR